MRRPINRVGSPSWTDLKRVLCKSVHTARSAIVGVYCRVRCVGGERSLLCKRRARLPVCEFCAVDRV